MSKFEDRIRDIYGTELADKAIKDITREAMDNLKQSSVALAAQQVTKRAEELSVAMRKNPMFANMPVFSGDSILRDISFVPASESSYTYKQRWHPTPADLDALENHAQYKYDKRTQDDTYANDGGSWLGCW